MIYICLYIYIFVSISKNCHIFFEICIYIYNDYDVDDDDDDDDDDADHACGPQAAIHGVTIIIYIQLIIPIISHYIILIISSDIG